MKFPSELEFCSFLQYSPDGTSRASETSRVVCRAIKTDSSILNGFWVIKEAGKRIAERLEEFPFLKNCFDSETVLVPIPRSSPLSDRNALWPGRRICEELLSQGLARDFVPALERTTAVTKAATAAKGRRPTPSEHFDSVRVAKQLQFVPQKITLVDDVITQGSTFIGLYPRMREAFPKSEIHCFALVRSMRGTNIDTILAPVLGAIEFSHGNLHREP